MLTDNTSTQLILIWGNPYTRRLLYSCLFAYTVSNLILSDPTLSYNILSNPLQPSNDHSSSPCPSSLQPLQRSYRRFDATLITALLFTIPSWEDFAAEENKNYNSRLVLGHRNACKEASSMAAGLLNYWTTLIYYFVNSCRMNEVRFLTGVRLNRDSIWQCYAQWLSRIRVVLHDFLLQPLKH